MTKQEFETYLKNLKTVFEEDIDELKKSPNNEDLGIMYDRGYITCIEAVLDKIKEVE